MFGILTAKAATYNERPKMKRRPTESSLFPFLLSVGCLSLFSGVHGTLRL